MALYAFDGTWNVDDPKDDKDTNVVKFRDLYTGETEYRAGVGTRLGAIGRAVGGIFGAGGRTRVNELYEALCNNWAKGDREIDIVGFSRGAALAVHFANKVKDEGVKVGEDTVEANIRFLGLWDLVGSFGLNFDTLIDFQAINIGWKIDSVPDNVAHCYHAMALDERRETFNVTRLTENANTSRVQECWFRGVHSDIGGGNENPDRSNIALQWMLDKAIDVGVPIDAQKCREPTYNKRNRRAKVSENTDPQRDPRRDTRKDDEYHETAKPVPLTPDGAPVVCRVDSALKYNYTHVYLEEGATYVFSVNDDDQWTDGEIVCGPSGWKTEEQDFNFIKEEIIERFEDNRRFPKADWFELIGAIGDEDDHLFRLGKAAEPGGHEYTAQRSGDLWLFANDLKLKYENNEGDLLVTIRRK